MHTALAVLLVYYYRLSHVAIELAAVAMMSCKWPHTLIMSP